MPGANPDQPGDAVPGHTWLKIAAGRVCRECQEAQATAEFDDSTPCRAAQERQRRTRKAGARTGDTSTKG